MNTVSSNRRTPLKGLGTIVLALLLVTAMWVPVFANHLPVTIDTANNQTVDGGTPVSLLATSSNDVTTHAWTADPAVGTFDNAAAEDTTWTAPATTTDDQVVMLTLSVTNSDEHINNVPVDASTIEITVRGADPTVSIQTADQTVFGGDSIDLQATSADLTTPVTSYLWTAFPVVGTFSNAVGAEDATVEDATWTAPATTTAIQVVTLTLTVTDNNGNDDAEDDITARDSVTITVRRGSVDVVSIEAPTSPVSVAGGASVVLEATSRSADVAGATRLWTATPNVGTFSNASAEDTMWTAPAATTADQVVTLSLTVTDGGGGGARASVTITVLSGPTVSIQTADQSVASEASIQLEATAENSGKGFRLAWTATNPEKVAVGRFSPSAAVPNPTWTAPAGAENQVVILTLTASDGGDENDVSDSVTITVRGTDPTVSIETPDRTRVLGGTALELMATSGDTSTDATITRLWTATAGTFSDATEEDATWTAPGTTARNQVVTLTLTVTDSDENTASASVTITVPSGPTVSIQTADQTVPGDMVVILEATSRRGADDKRITRLWTATDPEGEPVITGTFSNATGDDGTWTAPATAEATQVVTLTLTVSPSDADPDAIVGRASASVTITILGTDPTVSIETEDQTVAGGTVLQLQATAAASDGTIAMYAWAATNEAGMFSDDAVEDPTWTAPATTAVEQTVTLTLTVTDDSDEPAMATASVTITVPSGPTLTVETKDQTVPGGTVVNLLATSRSADVAGATRLWTATPNVGTFSNAAVEDATWTAPARTAATQVVTLTLTVTDNNDATGSASVKITIPGTDPTVSIETADQEVAGGAPIDLLATSADSGGTVATYAWTATPNVGTFSNAAAEDATWTAPGTTARNQVVTLTLTVTDSDGATASASVTITVRSGPTVSIQTADQTVFGGDSIDLLATARDSDGSDLGSYEWTAAAVIGTAVGTFDPDPANEEDVTWTAPPATATIQVVTLTLTVTASDAAMVEGSASVTITIPGTTPTVSIETEDQDVAGGTVLQLQATSADSDGTIATYEWATEAVTPGTFSDATVEDATWTAPTTTTDDQEVTLTLTVTDNGETSASDSVTITVPGTDPTVSIQTEDKDVAGGAPIELAAMSSTTDDVDSFAWTAAPAVGTFSGVADVVADVVLDVTATWTAPAATPVTQVVTLTLTVTDNDGNTASASVTITVPGTDPTVSIETMDQTVDGGTVVNLLATSADSDGMIAMYEWATDPATTGTFSDAAVEDATWTAPATTMDDQEVILTLVVTDNDDATASDSVTITVPGTDPTVSIETEDQDVAGGTVLSLSAMSSDDVAEYAWTADPEVGPFSDAAVEDATWTAPDATADDQVVTLTLTVTDSDGATASASVTITVSDSVMITVPGVSGGPVLASVRVDDGPSHDGTGNDSRGNDDGIAQSGETIELYVSIRNDGELALTGLSGELIETDPLVRLLYNASSRYPDVAAGSMQENRFDWDLRVSPDAPSGHEFSFTIRLTADEGGPWDILVTVPTGGASPPGVPGLAAVRVDDGPSHDGTGNDSRGNDDGIAQCGETIELYVSIRNDGELALTGLSGELIETDPLVRLLYNASSRYPDVAAGSMQENRRDWDLRVSPDAPSGHEFSFTIRLTADEGGPWDVLVTVPIACG